MLCGLAAANRQCAMVAACDLTADPQTQSGAVDAFGREERLEDLLLRWGTHANARVGHRKNQAFLSGLSAGRFTASQGQFAAKGHRIDRVPDQVAQHLPDLSAQTGDGLLRTLALFH